MGIKGWVTIGGAVLTGIAVWLGLKKKEDEHNERIQKMIREVDRKEPEKKEEEPKTVEEITADINGAMAGMDIDGGDEETQVTDEEEMTKEEWEAKQQELAEEAFKKAAEEAAREREKRQENGEWLKEVQEAAAIKSFSKLENLLNEKYNPYPYHPAPSDPYGQGYHEGVIDEKTYKAAQKYYGNLWNYSGD